MSVSPADCIHWPFSDCLTLFSLLTRDVAGAQERWPPWQSYGEAENAARKKALRRPGRLETDASLDRQIAQLKAAGKYAEAVPLAQRALALAEKKGANSPAVAKALDTLAGLYEAQNKYAEAEPLLKRSLAIREKSPGQPDVAASRERLAVAYDKMGRASDAQAVRGQRTSSRREERRGRSRRMAQMPSTRLQSSLRKRRLKRSAGSRGSKGQPKRERAKASEEGQAKARPQSRRRRRQPCGAWRARAEPNEPPRAAPPPPSAGARSRRRMDRQRRGAAQRG